MKLAQRLAVGFIRAKFKFLSAISKKKAAETAFELFCTPQSRHKKPLPKIFDRAEKLEFKSDDIIVRGWRWNHPAIKKVLILHGFESSVANFDRYIGPLIEKGYEVLAFDAPAHGRSDGSKINAPLYKRMILAINEKFGPVKSYLAHSFGGLAVCLALEEIGHSDDCRLVLIAPAAETSTAINMFFHFLRLDRGIRPEFDKMVLKTGGMNTEWYSIKRAMKHIRAKVLWFQDEDDLVTPLSDAMQVKAENYPQVEFVITKGLGHSRIYRDQKVVAAVIDFL